MKKNIKADEVTTNVSSTDTNEETQVPQQGQSQSPAQGQSGS